MVKGRANTLVKGRDYLRILISFDIDGTLEVGDPPGPITLEMVRRAREMGCIIGTGSDRPVSAQEELWQRNNMKVDFVSLKHKLGELKAVFQAEVYIHTGDGALDRQFAREAGFDFILMNAAAEEPWIAMLNGSALDSQSHG